MTSGSVPKELAFPALWNTNSKAPSPAAILDHEIPLRMDASQGQTATESPHPCPAEGLISCELTTCQTSEYKKKRNVHFLFFFFFCFSHSFYFFHLFLLAEG